MNREDFTIDHKIPWLRSDDPVRLYFEIENISYSHFNCNISAARRPIKLNRTREEIKAREAKRERERWNSLPKNIRQKRRRLSYKKYGC